MAIKFYVIDTETTGLNHRQYYHEITEVGIIRVDDRVQLFRKVKCETPKNASLDALAITGKTLADLNHGVSRDELIKEVHQFFNEDKLTPAHRCIIGHNIISFDRKFLHTLWETQGLEFPADLWVDTIPMTQQFISQSDESTLNITRTATGKISKKLQAACDLVGIKKIAAAHNAQADSRNNYFLWKKLLALGIDYLPHIKNLPHKVKEADVSELDPADVF